MAKKTNVQKAVAKVGTQLKELKKGNIKSVVVRQNVFSVKEFKKMFEEDENGIRRITARKYAELLQYDKWTNFNLLIKKAIKNVKALGIPHDIHFLPTSAKSKGGRKGADYLLSEYACAVIARVADDKKENVKSARKYLDLQELQTKAELHKIKKATTKPNQVTIIKKPKNKQIDESNIKYILERVKLLDNIKTEQIKNSKELAKQGTEIDELKAKVAHLGTLDEKFEKGLGMIGEVTENGKLEKFKKAAEIIEKNYIGSQINKLVAEKFPAKSTSVEHINAKKAYNNATGANYQGAKNATIDEKREYEKWLLK